MEEELILRHQFLSILFLFRHFLKIHLEALNLHGLVQIKPGLIKVVALGKNLDVVPPGNLVNKLLTNWVFWPSLGKHGHVFQICKGKAAHVWKFGAKVFGQLRQYF